MVDLTIKLRGTVSPLLLLFLLLVCSKEAMGQSEFSSGQPFVRTTDQDEFQVACKTYHSKSEPHLKIRLLGMIHVAEPRYYSLAQGILDRSNMVLIEGIHNYDGFIQPKDVAINLSSSGDRSQIQCHKLIDLMDVSNLIGARNTHIGQHLGLQEQSALLSYPSSRSRGADVSLKELFLKKISQPTAREVISKNNLEDLDICTQALAVHAQKHSGKIGHIDIHTLLKQSDMEFKAWIAATRVTDGLISQELTRKTLAKTLVKTLAEPNQGGDPEVHELIVTFRNEVALKHIQANMWDLQNGITTVVYGAAHMPGIEAGLIEMNFVPESEEWFTVFTY